MMMKFIRSMKTTWPAYLSVTLCLAGLGIAGWLISVMVRIQHDAKGYVMGLGRNGAKGQLEMSVKLGVLLLAINICITVISAMAFTWWRRKIMMREMCVKAALIKQKEATEEAERKSMSKSVAVANASHEVRTALAGITGLIQMCRADAAAAAVHSKLDDNLKHMESCTNDLYSMLNLILDASKIEAGKMQVEEEEFDLHQVLEDVVDLYYPLGMNKGVDVILDPCDESVEKFRHVKGDRGKVKQILCNLLYNAIKFTDEGYVALRVWARKPAAAAVASENGGGASSITIFSGCAPCILFRDTSGGQEEGLKRSGDNLVQRKEGVMEYIFKVVDTGKGIPKDKRNSVFENYAQVKEMQGGGNRQLGHGLGLGIVQSLVRLMGGEIGIEDKEIGERGSCFKFNIFLEIPQNHLQHIESHNNNCFGYSSSSTNGKGQCRVVVLMQCEERGKMIERFFESRGIKVSVVTKGHQQLSRKLKKIKRAFFHHSTTAPSYSSSSSSSSPSSSKEMRLGAMDETEDQTMPLRSNSNRYMVLIIIDTSAVGGAFPGVSRAVAEFHKDLQPGCARVLWIDSAAAQNKDNRIHLPSTDLLMSKPLQGSRLQHVLGLLPDFASTSQQGEIQVVIDKEKEEDESGPSSGSEKKALAGKRMLIVEDSPMLRKICSAVVSDMGGESYSCNNGEEALQLVSKALQNQHHQPPPFDYILMDCEMPIMDGFEATRRIKEEGKAMGIWIPIIALTAHTEKEEMKKISEAGMDYYIPKPINAANLLTAIHYLDKSQEENKSNHLL